MAIKYEIKTGSKFLNEIARSHRDLMKRDLKGMHCGKCSSDTVINFVEWEERVKPEINACCADFKSKIIEKSWPKK